MFYWTRILFIIILTPFYLAISYYLIEDTFSFNLVTTFTVIAAFLTLIAGYFLNKRLPPNSSEDDRVTTIVDTLFLLIYHITYTVAITETIPTADRFKNLWSWSGAFLIFHLAIVVYLVYGAVRGYSTGFMAMIMMLSDTTIHYSRPLDIVPYSTPFLWGVLLVFLLKAMEHWDRERWRTVTQDALFAPLIFLVVIGIATTLTAKCPYDAYSDLLRYGAYGLIYVLLLFNMSRKHQYLTGFHLLAINYAVLVLFGFTQFYRNVALHSWLYAFRQRLWIFGIHPNATAAACVVFILPFLALAWSSRKIYLKAIYSVLCLGCLFCMTFTFSKGGASGLACGILGAIFLHLWIKGQRGVIFSKWVTISLVVLVIMGLSALNLLAPRIDLLKDPLKSPTLGSRAVIYRTAMMTIRDYPWFGLGIFNHYKMARYGDRFNFDGQKKFEHWMMFKNRGAHCHNTILEAGVAGGLGAMAAILWLFFAFLTKGRRYLEALYHRNSHEYVLVLGLIGGGIGIAVNGLTDFPFGFSAPCVAFFFLSATISAVGRSEDCRFQKTTMTTTNSGENDENDPWKQKGYYLGLIITILVFVVLRAFALEFVKNPNQFNMPFQLTNSIEEKASMVQYIDRFDPWVYANYAKFLKEQQSFNDSLRYYRYAIGFDPENPSLHSSAGMVLKSMGKKRGAIEELKYTIEQDPICILEEDSYFDLAHLYYELGRHEEARTLIRRALLINPIIVKKIEWSHEFNIMGLLPKIRKDFSQYRAEDFFDDIYQIYLQKKNEDPKQALMYLNRLVEVLWTLGEFKGIYTILEENQLSPLIPLNKWPILIKTLLKWKETPGGRVGGQARISYDAVMAKGQEHLENEEIDNAMSSFLIAIDLKPTAAKPYYYMTKICRDQDYLVSESLYFKTFYEELSGKAYE